MCRILALWAKQEKKDISPKYKISEWLESWLKATKYDPKLELAYGLHPKRSNHPHGWGIVSLATDLNNLDWIQTNFDLNPAFNYKSKYLIKSILTPQLFKSSNQVVLAHARRASINTPLTSRQVQPFLIYDNINPVKIYLSHNGAVSSLVINELLNEELKISPAKLIDYSDTQVLTRFIFQRIKENNNLLKGDSTGLWIKIFKELIQRHDDKNMSYKMQLVILEMRNDIPEIISCSALSNDSESLMPYYQFYTIKMENFSVLCSSTVFDYFKKARRTSNWEVNEIENYTFAKITNKSKVLQKKIN